MEGLGEYKFGLFRTAVFDKYTGQLWMDRLGTPMPDGDARSIPLLVNKGQIADFG